MHIYNENNYVKLKISIYFYFYGRKYHRHLIVEGLVKTHILKEISAILPWLSVIWFLEFSRVLIQQLGREFEKWQCWQVQWYLDGGGEFYPAPH